MIKNFYNIGLIIFVIGLFFMYGFELNFDKKDILLIIYIELYGFLIVFIYLFYLVVY